MIARGDFHLVVQSPVVHDPRLVWVTHHCFPVNAARTPTREGLRFTIYYCGRPSLP